MIKILLIEDAESDIKTVENAVERMNDEDSSLEIELTVADNFENAIKSLNNSFHGAIVDIRLSTKEEEDGNIIIDKIIKEFRIPIAVMTGTPDTKLDPNSPIKIYKKGEHLYKDIIKSLISMKQTGLFDVIGGKGIIEKTIDKIFWNNLYPQISSWEELYKKGIDTEKALMRYTVSCLQELLDEDTLSYVTEEMYIKPPITSNIKTGSIVQEKKSGQYMVVLSPPCDLALHNGEFKTDRILLCEIDNHEEVNKKIIEEIKNNSKQVNALKVAINNQYAAYYHWLPENMLFNGGYINFRKVLTYDPLELLELFNEPELKIQEYFVKNILSRFSSYYARQGQPYFDFKNEAEKIVQELCK